MSEREAGSGKREAEVPVAEEPSSHEPVASTRPQAGTRPRPASRSAFPVASGAGFQALLRHRPWPGILVLRILGTGEL